MSKALPLKNRYQKHLGHFIIIPAAFHNKFLDLNYYTLRNNGVVTVLAIFEYKI